MSKGLWDYLGDAASDADLGDYGDLLGGMGKFGTGLFSMFQGNDMMDLYKTNLDAQLQHQKDAFAANSRQYNNQLWRNKAGSASIQGDDMTGVTDQRQYIGPDKTRPTGGYNAATIPAAKANQRRYG